MFFEPYLGAVSIFGGNFAPRGWALCNGQLLSIAQNTALFSLLGTTYGGNGQTTFALPDLRGRIAMHPDGSNFSLGQSGGTESTSITVQQMPIHVHTVLSISGAMAASTAGGSIDFPNGAYPAQSSSDLYNTSPDGAGMAVANINAASPVAGAGGPVPILSPYLTMNYCIAMEGIYPSRN
jgi:microcystin-dependent protein